MPSPEMLAFNALARTNLRAAINADYDPIEFRLARETAPELELQSTILPVGGGAIELRPSRNRQRMIAYVAGGGFCFDANDAHRRFTDDLADRVGADACLVRYRLAPEQPFPAALDDVAEGLGRLIEERGGEHLAVVADSAGAALVLSAVMTHISEGRSSPQRMAFLSALTDMAMTGRSNVTNAEADPFCGPQAVIHKAIHYLQGHNPTDPRASPYWGEPSGLPPCLFLVGSTEVMRDDSVRFAEKAAKAGVDARLSVYEEAPHTFPLLGAFPEAAEASQEIAAFLKEGWP